MARLITVAAVDDDQMLLEGLAGWVVDQPDLRIVATAATTAGLLDRLSAPVDVVLLDLILRNGTDPADNVRRLVGAGNRVLVLSVWSEPDQVAATFAAGAVGYLTKDHDLGALAAAIRAVAGGALVFSPELALACLRDRRPSRPRLSPQEQAVLVAYASGMTLKAAARHIGVRPETARTYLDRVKVKYQQAGRPTFTKLDLAERVREDGLRPGGPGPDTG